MITQQEERMNPIDTAQGFKQAETITPVKQKKKREKQNRFLRAVIQAIYFFSMPSAFVAGFSGIKYLFRQMGEGAVLELNSFIVTLVILCVFTIFFGRFFCGYICAFGTLGDFLYWISGLVQKKLFKRKKQIRFPEKILPILQKIKYGIVVAIILLCVLNFYEKFSGTSPWDVFSMLALGNFHINGYQIGFGIFLLIVIGMTMQERFFCQILCPMGAVFAMLPILPSASLQRKASACASKCHVCQSRCCVALQLEENSTRSGECIRCGRCTDVCPKGNIHSFFGYLSGNEWWLVLVKAILFFIFGTLCGLSRFIP